MAYRTAKWPVHAFLRFWCDVEMSGRHHIPRRGPAVLTANHLSFMDPVFVSLAAHENVRYLAIDDLMGKSAFFDRLLGYWGAIPTPRDRPPIGAVRAALRQLETGGPVGVFPEGRRVTYWGEERPRRGAGWLSVMTGAPIIPIALYGTHGILSNRQPAFRPSPVRIWVAEPIWPHDHMDAIDPATSMMEAWRHRMDELLAPWFDDTELGRDATTGHNPT